MQWGVKLNDTITWRDIIKTLVWQALHWKTNRLPRDDLNYFRKVAKSLPTRYIRRNISTHPNLFLKIAPKMINPANEDIVVMVDHLLRRKETFQLNDIVTPSQIRHNQSLFIIALAKPPRDPYVSSNDMELTEIITHYKKIVSLSGSESDDRGFWFLNHSLLPSVKEPVFPDVNIESKRHTWIHLLKYIAEFHESNNNKHNNATHMLMQHKLTKRYLTRNDIVFLLYELLPVVVHSIKLLETGHLCEMQYVLTMAKRLDPVAIFLCVAYNARYIQLYQLFDCIYKCLSLNHNHYLLNTSYESMLISEFIYILSKRIRKTYAHALDLNFPVQLKYRLDKLCKLITKCKLKNWGKHNKRLVKYMKEIGSTTLSRCNYEKCNIPYMRHKYAMGVDELLQKSKTQQTISTINHWFVCSGCEVYYYCSKSCQKKDWVKGGHRSYCKYPWN